MGEGTLRALKIAAIGMAVLIVLGTTTLFVMLAKRGIGHGAEPVVDQIATILDEPAGTRITSITATQDRVAVQLTGGGTDRIVVVDPRSGRIVGRIALVR